MKKIALALIVSLTALNAQQAGEGPGDDNASGHTRFWTYYDPYPSNYIGSRDWWNGETLSGDWWGIRNYLDDSGVELSAGYTNNIAGNPVGGTGKGFTYTDNVSFGLELNFEKLIGWQGLTLAVSGLNRAGSSLSQDFVRNQFTVQQVYGGQTAMFYALAFEQRLLEDKISIKFGRFSTGDDFASSPVYWLYMNNGIDGNPQALPVNTQFSAYPWAVWATRLRVEPTPECNAMIGAYQVSNRVFNREYHGLDWSMRQGDGVLLISQFGWTPEFFKKPVEKAPASDGKTALATKARSEGKSFKAISPETEMKGLPGHYWFGAYYSPWTFNQIGLKGGTATNSYGFYWHADQMIWQEAPGSDQGLTLWSAFVLSPQQNIAKLPFQANAGAFYKGLIPARDDDYTIFGFVYGKFSDQNFVQKGDVYVSTDYEIVLELGYRVNLSKFAYVQPDLQYVINPGGSGTVPNALVLGAQMSVVF